MKKGLITICFILNSVILFAGDPPNSKELELREIFSLGESIKQNTKRYFIYPEWGFFADVSVGMSYLENKNISSDIWNSEGDLGYNFNAGYFHALSKYFKIKTGLGVSSFKSSLTGNGEVPAKQLIDIDNDIYTESLILSDVKNNINLTYLSVPIIVEFGNLNISTIGFYIDLGVKYSFLVNDDFKPNGTYSTRGTYDQWGITLENIPELGFYKEKNTESNAVFNKSNFSVIGGAGITLPVSSVIILRAGLTGNIGLTQIGNNMPGKTNDNAITAETYEYRSQYIDNSFAVSKGTRTLHIGFEFGLYINKLLK